MIKQLLSYSSHQREQLELIQLFVGRHCCDPARMPRRCETEKMEAVRGFIKSVGGKGKGESPWESAGFPNTTGGGRYERCITASEPRKRQSGAVT